MSTATEQSIGQVIYGALSDLEWPVRLQNYISTEGEGTYITYYLTGQTDAVRASGASRRQVQRAQVSIYAEAPLVGEIHTVVARLKAAGLRVTSAGSQAYDSATEMYSAPITV